MLRVLTIAAILVLVLLRLARTRFGSRLLGISQRTLGGVFLIALAIAGVLAVVYELWILLAAVGVLLVLHVLEELRRRAAGPTKDRPLPRVRR